MLKGKFVSVYLIQCDTIQVFLVDDIHTHKNVYIYVLLLAVLRIYLYPDGLWFLNALNTKHKSEYPSVYACEKYVHSKKIAGESVKRDLKLSIIFKI